MPPWASSWVSDHWFMSSCLAALMVASVFGVIRAFIVNVLKIFHRRPINVVVNVTQPGASTDQIQTAVRDEIQSNLDLRRFLPTGRSRLQFLNDD
jgi:hypothetical protein